MPVNALCCNRLSAATAQTFSFGAVQMNLFVKGAMLTAVVAVFGATSASAQNTDNDNIDVTATVETALDVVGVTDLAFGPVFPGFGRTIAATDASSGEFLIDGGNGGGVAISLSLPTDLASGGNLLPVTFTAAAGADRATAAGFDPSAPHANHLSAGSGELRVFLGGQVTAAANQPAGNYSALVTLTASYNGL
jgi:hypothetical protein